MHRRGKAERRGLGRHVVHAPVGDEDGAGDAVVRHVGERGGERREQPRAVGLAVGLPGLDEAHLEPGDAAEPFGERGAHRFGLLRARSPNSWLGLLSTTTTATEVSGSRSSRVSDGLASASTNSASAMRAQQRRRGCAPNTSRSESANATQPPPTRCSGNERRE